MAGACCKKRLLFFYAFFGEFLPTKKPDIIRLGFNFKENILLLLVAAQLIVQVFRIKWFQYKIIHARFAYLVELVVEH